MSVLKKDFVAEVAEKLSLTKKEATDRVEAVFGAVEEYLVDGENVQLTGFGSFKLMDRAARKGRNPQTGEEIDIPATRTVTFKAGKNLKERVENN